MQTCLREWLYGVFVGFFVFAVFFRKKKTARISADGKLRGPSLPVPSSSWTSMPCHVSDRMCLRNAEILEDSLSNVIPKALETPQQHGAPQQDLQEGERAKQFTPFFLLRVFKKTHQPTLRHKCSCQLWMQETNKLPCLICKQNGPPPNAQQKCI